jgi:hypothetical protein
MSRPRKRLLTFNDPQPLRIDRRLAMEIGFVESVVLLQLEFLISISDNYRDGMFWTYHTLKDLKERHFPWLSQATICRTLQILEDKQLIIRRHYNRSGFDRTQWFALHYDGIARLTSVVVGEDAPILQFAKSTLQNEKSILQNETSILQGEKSILQGETTIPKNPTKNPTENNTNHANKSPAAEEDQVVVALLESLVALGITRKRAEALIAARGPESVRRQIEMLPYRKAEDPAAVLVRAIDEDWAPPARFGKATSEHRAEERRRSRQEERSKEQAAKEKAEQTRRSAEDAFWESLDQDGQAEINARAETTLRKKNPFLFSSQGPKSVGPAYRALMDAERRAIITQMLPMPSEPDSICSEQNPGAHAQRCFPSGSGPPDPPKSLGRHTPVLPLREGIFGC